MDEKLKSHLVALADKYETEDFLASDPSQFMHRYSVPSEQERAAFIAAALSYGSRKQFIPKIGMLLENMETGILPPDDDGCFYRLHTNRMVRRFLSVVDNIFSTHGSMLNWMTQEDVHTGLDAVRLITDHFSAHSATDLIPKNTTSACKRVCMFLRWMTRDNSPVDLGLWSRQIDKSTLIMPLDTHVLQETARLGLADIRTGRMSAAIRLTETMKEVFHDDPTRADFALFGLGVDDKTAR